MSGMAARGIERFLALPPYRRRAALVGLVWVVVVVSYAIGFLGSDGPSSRGTTFIDGLFFLVALVLPLMLVWMAARFAEELAHQRQMIAALAELTPPLIEALQGARAALDRHGPASPAAIEAAVRQGLLAGGAGARETDPRPVLASLAAAQARTEATLRDLLDRLSAPPPAAEPTAEPEPAPRKASRPRKDNAAEAPAQPDLPLSPQPAPAAADRLDWPTLVRALNFPRDPDDNEGFRALRTALRHHSLAQMLQAAEDVLSLLAQEGVFVDDFDLGDADPSAWRRFIAGTRGPEVDAVGTVRDPKVLDTAARMVTADPIFRDTALFFHRRFDAVLIEFASDADDAQLAALADTRSARAFMLLARLNGAFD